MDKERLAEIERSLRIAEDDLSRLQKHKEFLIDQVTSLKREREILLNSGVTESPARYPSDGLGSQSDERSKIGLFRSLFRGREDVYPRRFESRSTGKSGYQPDCRNEWVAGVCNKPQIKCSRCDRRQFVPVSDEVIRKHLRGTDSSGRDFTIGVYPLLPDDACWFLAVDFDESDWLKDAQAYRETCERHSIPAILERSRSGNGAHVWIFFCETVPAKLARNLGSLLLTETIEQCSGITLKSYDRFFPNQDTLPRLGFGNLIALPLQRKPREKGNSVFLDVQLEPYKDQWAYLSSIRRLGRNDLERLVNDLFCLHQELGVCSAFEKIADEEPWNQKRFAGWKTPDVHGPLPEKLNVTLANQLYIPREQLSSSLCNRLVRIAAFPNPEFYRTQAMRLSTYGKPRIVSCAQDFPEYVALPRGCLQELLDLLRELGVSVCIDDRRTNGKNLNLQFHGELNQLQMKAAETLLKQETGVLVAPTAFGKTVVAAWLIARRQVSTLVLVHTRQLMDQWINRLEAFLGLQVGEIGQIGAGRMNATGQVDVGILQSFERQNEAGALIEKYGQIIVDECHHISARSFERVVRVAKARFVTGFSATIERKDGHHPIIFMQCGPVRHRVTVKTQQASDQIERLVRVRKTGFTLPKALKELMSLTIHDVYESLIHDEQRNQRIVSDALCCLREGFYPLVLTERREHLELLAKRLKPAVSNLVVLTGGMNQKQRKAAALSLRQEGPRLVLATGRYLGEGFDDDRLDTLLLALPISWKGTLAQYAGRLHRIREGKRAVTIYDYADLEVPMLTRMFQRRLRGYKQIGYRMDEMEADIKPDENAGYYSDGQTTGRRGVDCPS
jgi:superfamily II DNA or RNA helicase